MYIAWARFRNVVFDTKVALPILGMLSTSCCPAAECRRILKGVCIGFSKFPATPRLVQKPSVVRFRDSHVLLFGWNISTVVAGSLNKHSYMYR